MLRRVLAPLIVTACALGACSGDDDSGAPATTTAETQASSQLPSQYGQRYCEVLAVTVTDDAATAEVWGTQGLNDCPQAAFDTLDPTALANELGATLAVPNGPRHWVLDSIVANELAGSGETRNLGGIDMRSIAIVELAPGAADRTPFTETSVVRDTEFIFDAGRQIHELTAPDGSVYVMQSYSIEADPTQTLKNLTSLAERLQLPESWTFTSRVLGEPLVVEDIDGVATVIQDELRNTYQLRTRG